VTVAAALRGAHVEVTVADDGRGLDVAAIRARARQQGLAAPADDRDLARLLFTPGFSTAKTLTSVSGRGVGLDVVKAQVEAMHGSVEVFSEALRGTRFVLTVPLTLTTVSALLVVAGGQTYALPTAGVRSLVRFTRGDLRPLGGCDVLTLDGQPLRVADLAQVLGLPHGQAEPRARQVAVVVAVGQERAALVVDGALDEQETVVKGLGPRIRHTPLVSGATLLPSGRVALLLNLGAVLEAVAGGGAASLSATTPVPTSAQGAPTPHRLLVAEDSLTTRALVKSILEAHGYQVDTAADGQDAWGRLQERRYDLVVSDVDMPRMDGFALVEAIRGSGRLARLPVVLVTARENDQDKARGALVGADAYLVKSAFDQTTLLETIGQLL
jgi:two-component system chemotaxis sensor kinase CheA